jgi:hypothetical protein
MAPWSVGHGSVFHPVPNAKRVMYLCNVTRTRPVVAKNRPSDFRFSSTTQSYSSIISDDNNTTINTHHKHNNHNYNNYNNHNYNNYINSNSNKNKNYKNKNNRSKHNNCPRSLFSFASPTGIRKWIGHVSWKLPRSLGVNPSRMRLWKQPRLTRKEWEGSRTGSSLLHGFLVLRCVWRCISPRSNVDSTQRLKASRGMTQTSKSERFLLAHSTLLLESRLGDW